MKSGKKILESAMLHKEELEKLFYEHIYDDEMFYYMGCAHANVAPVIRAEENFYQYAIVYDEEVVGYLSYSIMASTNSACNFGLMSFKNCMAIGEALNEVMDGLLRTCRRIEWRMVGGNPVKRTYDRFCERHSGNVVVLHDVTVDKYGNYHDEYIYEILCGKNR